jgi:PAS domain S-box-containing protein
VRSGERTAAPGKAGRPRVAKADGAALAARRLRASESASSSDYRRYREFTSEAIWHFSIHPAVRTGASPEKQAESVLQRAVLTECSAALARFYGFQCPEDMTGALLSRLLPGSHDDQVRFVAQCIRSGYQLFDVEAAVQDRRGKTVWMLINLSVVVERGNIVEGWGSSRDITDRKTAEAALHASEERLQLALTAASDGVYDVDLRTGETYYSPGYYTMLGYAPGEFAPSDEAWENLLHPDDKARALDMRARCVSGAVDEAETEFRLRTKTGDWRHIISRGRVVARDKDGRALRLVGTHRDITAQSRGSAQLREERDRAQAYLDIAEVMLLALDSEGRVSLINRKGCRLLGYDDPSALIGTDWFTTHVPASAADETRAVFRRMMDGEVQPVEYHENPVVTQSGEERQMAWHNALLRDPSGRIIGSLSSGEDITGRRLAERALENTVSLLSRSEEISHVGSWELTPAENRLVWSDELYRIFGLDPQESPPTNEAFYEIVHPEDREGVAATYLEAVREGKDGYEHEHRIVRPRTGEVRYILEKGSFVQDPGGTLLRVFGVVQDVTERGRAEAAARESEEKYRLLVENAGEAVFVAQDGVLKFANPATARMIGRSVEELLARPFVELVCPEDRSMVIDRHRRRLAGEDVETGYDFRVIHADGSLRWVQISAVQIAWEGRPATLNFVTDIHERRMSEEARRESEERFRRIFAESPIGMVTVSPEFRFTRANDAFCRMLGYTEAELLARSFVDVTHPDHVKQDVEFVKRLALGEISVYRTEKKYIRKDGRGVWGALTSSAMRDADGRLQYFLSMIEDVTPRRQAEAELAERESRYRELADDLPTCVFEADLEGRLTFANRTGRDWFGYSEGDIRGGKSIIEMVADEERDRAATTLRQAVEKGSVPSGEYTALRKDGSTFPSLVSSRAVVKDGRAVGIRGILIDITERVEAARRIESALEGTIRALAVTTEMRDPYTAGHQERVTRLAAAIGQEIGLSQNRLEGLRVAGTLHDVGKVSVPAEILSKPTSLTPTEFGLVKVHPQSGYEILQAIDFPWPVADIVLQHHERMDGSGYPRGLIGDVIVLEARILAVADVIEAIVSHRPYRPAQPMATAMDVVVRAAGTLYDADVVAACKKLYEEKRLPLSD